VEDAEPALDLHESVQRRVAFRLHSGRLRGERQEGESLGLQDGILEGHETRDPKVLHRFLVALGPERLFAEIQVALTVILGEDSYRTEQQHEGRCCRLMSHPADPHHVRRRRHC